MGGNKICMKNIVSICFFRERCDMQRATSTVHRVEVLFGVVKMRVVLVLVLMGVMGSVGWGGEVPGVVIVHSAAATGIYVGSPGIAILAGGDYVIKCDLYGPSSREYEKGDTVVFGSKDRGATWDHLSDVAGQYWSNIFVHRGELYLMGTDRQGGAVVIRRSRDGGETWTEPSDPGHGLLLEELRYHTAPMPVVVHKGRIWRAMEDTRMPDREGHKFRPFVMSAPVEADLLQGRNWTCSNRVWDDSKWLGGKYREWLEGNVVVTPEGGLANMMRVDYRPMGGKAAILEVSEDGRESRFDPETGFVDFPGGNKKFTVRYDEKSGMYWTLSNAVLPEHRGGNAERTRNALALMRSADLRKWEIRSIVLYHPDVARHGFQYVDWLIEGADMVVASRTSYDDGMGGAHNQHDANYITFHRIENFREMGWADSVVSSARALGK